MTTPTHWRSALLADPSPAMFLVYADWLEEQGRDEKTVKAWRRAKKYAPYGAYFGRWGWFNGPIQRSLGPSRMGHWASNVPLKLFAVMARRRYGYSYNSARGLWLIAFKKETSARQALVYAMLEVYP